MLENYILCDIEFNALDRVIVASHLDSVLNIIQKEKIGDCFIDEENEGEILSLKDGLQIIYESDANINNFEAGMITENEFNLVNQLFERFRII